MVQVHSWMQRCAGSIEHRRSICAARHERGSERSPGRELHNKADKLLAAVDLAGTFLFAVEGAIAAIHGNLDFLGMVVLAFVTAVGGGIIRDLLIGAIPPGAVSDWRYTAIAMAGAATAFFFHEVVQEIPIDAHADAGCGGAGCSRSRVRGRRWITKCTRLWPL